MGSWEEYDIVRQVRANGLLIGVSFCEPRPDNVKKDWWVSRAVRDQMLKRGVWAISDREDTIRMYPALNMDESVLREGLESMHQSIRHVLENGHDVGDSLGWPTGVAGF
jgi:acetylornithine/succinyldiaminopimelate/putrescine aminotransferase